MRKSGFAVLGLIFGLLVIASSQEIFQGENRDRAMAAPGSHKEATSSLQQREPRSKESTIRKPAPGNSGAPSEEVQAPHAGVIQNRQAGSVASTYSGDSGPNGMPATTTTQAPAAARYVFGQSDYVTPLKPRSVVTCDFTGDGAPDVAVSDSTDTTITVFLGKPDATMTPAPSFDVGHKFLYLGCGDFNEDGLADLAVVSNEGFLDIYLSDGYGTFRAPIEYGIPAGFLDLTVADLDGDGSLDLIAEGNFFSVLVFYGHGDGTFDPYKGYATFGRTHGPAPVAVGDLNGDGKLDMTVARENFVCVLLNNGPRSFQPCSEYGTFDYSIYGVAIGDFNGDHKLDLALSRNSLFPDTVSILLGAGDGTFPTHTEYGVAAGPHNIATVDVNGDGMLDVITAGIGGAVVEYGTVSVLLGNGDGTFQANANYGVGTSPTMVARDFNGDGVPDLAIAAQGCLTYLTACVTGDLTIWLGKGDGSFPKGTNYAMPDEAMTVAVGDLNGDHMPDVVVGNKNGKDSNTVSVLINNGDGTFQPRVDYVAGTGTTSVVLGDFNGDRLLDVAVGNIGAFNNENSVSILLGTGTGTLRPHVEYPSGPLPATIVAGDFNRDGKLDLVTIPAYQLNLSILLGNGDGSFQPAQQFSCPIVPATGVAGDVNGDGKLDLVIVGSGPIAVLLGNGDGTFQPPMLSYSIFNSYRATLADLDGNGKLDLTVTDFSVVWVLRGNGDGTFQPPVSYPGGSAPSSISVADMNGDGKLDLVDGVLWNAGILYGGGAGGFNAFAGYGYGEQENSDVITADFNGDGAIDIARENWNYGSDYTSQLTILLSYPVIALYPSNFNFPPTVLGDTSLPGQFLISNPGSAPVKISSIVIAGDFAQTNNCPETLGVGASCTITATFTPTDLGLRTGSITIQDNALAGTQVIHLSGVANSALKLSSTSLSFVAPPGKTHSRWVTLSNRSSLTILISKIVISGRDSADFSQTNACGNIVPAHGSCALTFTFKPARPGTKLAGASISDSDPGSPQVIILRGVSRY